MKNIIKISNVITKTFFVMCVMCVFAGLIFARERASSFVDERDGKTYRIVTIGSQTWMAENLNFATSSGSWCYDNNESNCNTYGRLYDWNTAMTACPAGWRLPSHEDWSALENTVGGRQTAGTKLKSSSGWQENGNGTDDFNFSALPGGSFFDGHFDNVGYNGNWWSATENVATNARYRDISYNRENVFSNWDNKSNGFSVRCLQE